MRKIEIRTGSNGRTMFASLSTYQIDGILTLDVNGLITPEQKDFINDMYIDGYSLKQLVAVRNSIVTTGKEMQKMFENKKELGKSNQVAKNISAIVGCLDNACNK